MMAGGSLHQNAPYPPSQQQQQQQQQQTPQMETETQDSRKRPLDPPTEATSTKRSNTAVADPGTCLTDLEDVRPVDQVSSNPGMSNSSPSDVDDIQFPDISECNKMPENQGSCSSATSGGPEEGELFLKVLIPSYAAGSIIGKGGQTIVQLQRETGATIKLSKSKDFYPGTTERVCLVQGTAEALLAVHNFIAEKIREVPQGAAKTDMGVLMPPQTTINAERAKQAKLIVPNTTAGLIIGKGGATVRSIMEESGAWVQLSQKPAGPNLQERVVTVSGEASQVQNALRSIIHKAKEDPPQGNAHLNISYINSQGPVANSNPTGSPYAGGTVEAALTPFPTAPPAPPAITGGDLLAISTALNTLASYGYSTGLGFNPLVGGVHPAAVSLLASYTGEAAPALGLGGGGILVDKLAAESVAGKETLEMAVPETLVGAILGKGGKTLVEYQELTGARIQISKKGEFVPGTRSRKVTITGPPGATQAAQYLIGQRVAYEQGVRSSNPQKVG